MSLSRCFVAQITNLLSLGWSMDLIEPFQISYVDLARILCPVRYMFDYKEVLATGHAFQPTISRTLQELNVSTDPVLFLHHTQLDRIWFKWQQQDPQRRLVEYVGNGGGGLDDKALLEHELEYGDLLPAVSVKDVMDTQSSLLCYRY